MKINLQIKNKYSSHFSFTPILQIFAEVLADPSVVAKVSDTKAMGEVRALEQFYNILQVEPAKAFYGLKHIQRANEAQAVETLLISDNLFRLVNLFTSTHQVV